MTEYRNERLVRDLEKEIELNECGVSDCCWCFCCGFFGLLCIVPKYNKRKLANDRLIIELQKPKRPTQAREQTFDQSVQIPPLQQIVPVEPQNMSSPPPVYEKTG